MMKEIIPVPINGNSRFGIWPELNLPVAGIL